MRCSSSSSSAVPSTAFLANEASTIDAPTSTSLSDATTKHSVVIVVKQLRAGWDVYWSHYTNTNFTSDRPVQVKKNCQFSMRDQLTCRQGALPFFNMAIGIAAVVHKARIRAFGSSIDNLAILIVQEVKVFLVYIYRSHTLFTEPLRDNLSTIFDN